MEFAPTNGKTPAYKITGFAKTWKCAVMMNKLKNLTRETRLELAINLMEILSPSTAKWFHNTLTAIHNVPRPFTKMLKQQPNSTLTGAEIGFGNGTNFQNLLDELPIKKLYSIDPYINQPYQQGNMTINQYQNKNTLKIYWKQLPNPRCSFIQKPSSEAANHFQKGELDFVYIDGNHTYPYVKQDLELYTPLIKKGGFIGGHDYIFGQTGVIKAAQEHAISLGKAPTIDFPDYWFQV